MTDLSKPQVEMQVCPKCETLTPSGEIYCLGCGFEFATGTEGMRPFLV